MKKTNTIYFTLAVLLLAGLLAFGSFSPAKKENPACCKNPATKCEPTENKPAPENTLLENLSGQFIHIPSFQ
jgi:hypothetical protein